MFGVHTLDASDQIFLAHTSIIAVRDERRIVVGADSKVTLVGGPSNNIICKIIQIGDTFFALSGLAYAPWTSFNAYYIAAESCRRGASVLEKNEIFESLVTEPLSRTIEYIMKSTPEQYESNYREDTCLTIIFFGIENDSPMISGSNFERTVNENGEVKIEIERLGGSGFTGCIVLGKSDAIGPLLLQPYIFRMGYVEAVNALITMETRRNPQDVGLPIDILEVTRDGARWVQRKVGCPDIQDNRESNPNAKERIGPPEY